MDIPLNTPICLKAHTGNNLQNEFFWRNGRCNNQNTEAWEQMMLIKTEDEKIIIQSRWNGRNLQVQESGQCVFANHNQELWEKFEMESDKDGKVYFISCHTGNVMQCNEDGFAWCVNKNRQDWEAWTIILPENTSMMTSGQLRTISLTVTGAAVCPVVGLRSGRCTGTCRDVNIWNCRCWSRYISCTIGCRGLCCYFASFFSSSDNSGGCRCRSDCRSCYWFYF
jgi:hypothetical protein